MRGEGLQFLFLFCGTLSAFSCALGAPLRPAIGTVFGSGQIRVDGAPAPSGTVLFSGDRVATDSTGRVSIYLTKGNELALGASTAARVTANNNGWVVRLVRGKLAASTRPGAPVVVDARNVTIESKQPNSFYEVALTSGGLKVLARRGVILVKSAHRTVALRAGHRLSAAVSHGRSDAKRGKVLLPTLVVAAAAAAGAGLGLDLVPSNQTSCISPSQLNCP